MCIFSDIGNFGRKSGICHNSPVFNAESDDDPVVISSPKALINGVMLGMVSGWFSSCERRTNELTETA